MTTTIQEALPGAELFHIGGAPFMVDDADVAAIRTFAKSKGVEPKDLDANDLLYTIVESRSERTIECEVSWCRGEWDMHRVGGEDFDHHRSDDLGVSDIAGFELIRDDRDGREGPTRLLFDINMDADLTEAEVGELADQLTALAESLREQRAVISGINALTSVGVH